MPLKKKILVIEIYHNKQLTFGKTFGNIEDIFKLFMIGDFNKNKV